MPAIAAVSNMILGAAYSQTSEIEAFPIWVLGRVLPRRGPQGIDIIGARVLLWAQSLLFNKSMCDSIMRVNKCVGFNLACLWLTRYLTTLVMGTFWIAQMFRNRPMPPWRRPFLTCKVPTYRYYQLRWAPMIDV